FFFSSRRRHTRWPRDWSSDVCSSDLTSYVSAGDYGRIELLMSVMAVAVVVIRGGANFGFIRFYFLDKDLEYRRRLIRTVFWAQMTYSTLALALCVLFAPQIANGLGIAYE